MAKQLTALEEVQDHMKELKELKAADLETIGQQRQETSTALEAANLAMRRAAEVMDIDAYEKAEKARAKAQTALDMFNARYDQIRQQEYISEEESDKAIKRLLDFEAQLAEDFKAGAAVYLKQLEKLLAKYRADVLETEVTLTAWQRDIHANYSTFGSTLRLDPITNKRTDRMLEPVLVHRLPYTGCDEAAQLGNYLKKAAAFYKGQEDG